MSPLIIQNEEASSRLVRQFGIKGRVPVLLDEIIVPVTDVGDFAGRSPFQGHGRRLGSDTITSPAAGVGTYAGLLITPAAGTVCVIERLWVDTATNARYLVDLFRPVDVAAVTVTAATQPIARTDGRVRSTGFIEQVGATYSIFNHNTVSIGGRIGEFRVPANWTTEFPIGRGVYLDGNDPLGPISLAVMAQTANASAIVGWQLAEYTLVE